MEEVPGLTVLLYDLYLGGFGFFKPVFEITLVIDF